MVKETVNKSARVWSKAVVLGYKRSQVNQYPQFSLLKIEGLNDKQDTKFYLGKKCVFLNPEGKKKNPIWGKIVRHHGNSGVVRARFAHHLPPSSFGHRVRVMMFPSSI